MIKIGKIVFGTLFFLVSTQIFAQKNPCNFTEERKGDTVIYKGEMNYLGTTHAELRISLQFQMIGNELGLVFGLNNIDGISMDSTNVAYIQLANDKEYILRNKSHLPKTTNVWNADMSSANKMNRILYHMSSQGFIFRQTSILR